MVRKYASDVYGHIPRETHRRPRRYFHSRTFFHSWALTDHTGLSRSDCSLEAPNASEHRPPSGCYYRSTPTDLRSDIGWGPDRVHLKPPGYRQDKSRKRHFRSVRTRRLRIRQLFNVADGLGHLHSCDIIHGDLKGVRHRSRFCLTVWLTSMQSNILVDASGHARITDFGLVAVTQNLNSVRNDSDGCGDNARWIAPEILNGQGTHSMEADVFSFSMVAIEVRCILPA